MTVTLLVIGLLIVAPIYIWAYLHIHKSTTTWSRFDAIEDEINQIRQRVAEMDRQPPARKAARSKRYEK